MSRRKVPDAWDDDWEPEGAPLPPADVPKPQANSRMTKAERLALHEESNRKLWQSADAPDDQPQYLPATNHVSPAAPAFKPSMKVLSRRPTPARAPGAGGGDDYDDDDEARRLAASQPSPEEARLRQQREREERQRRYDEARAKIFGEPAAAARPGAASSGASTPGAVTPPLQQQQHHHHHQTEAASGNAGGRQNGNRGRGRGGRGGYRGDNRSHDRGNANDGQMRRPPGTRELYDPNSSPKPQQRRGGGEAASSSGTTTPREEDQVRLQALRSPKGPEAGGRGGFGFARPGGGSDI
ncbi:hypothetical protein GGTG_10200 [Gaeumannomyces tritici R3-111a-1]|uniref:Uncharacterized protein n=1 Tax=Gaeumannomyces tritici (strain R3-111a-1) TaxID=644352 RepID=J3P9M0_GAET3|nr:hypothetical protein GGTG_10200 [Gaeumannomyces tritici R3-111a-1]EJT73356.1 hypothetical protein GGTG_10200 [Gaeumannomyces tritici R3-111a-1]